MMKMIIHYDTVAEFFFQGWTTKDSLPLFYLWIVLVSLFAILISVCFFRIHYKRVFAVGEPILEFIGMYIIMTYNFWVLLAYIGGRTLGYGWALYQRQVDLK